MKSYNSTLTSAHRRPRLPRLALAVALLSASAPWPAQADTESAAKVAADIWAQWKEEIKKGGCLSAAALTAIFSAGATAASTAETYQKCYGTVDKFDQIATTVVARWNQLVGNKWAAIGARDITFGKTQSGTLVSTGGRMFISAAPVPANIDEVEIQLKKEDGKGKTSVVVSKVGANGKATTLWSFTIGAGDDNTGKVWRKTFADVAGYVIAVHLDCKSVTRKFEYEFKATMRDTKAEGITRVIR